MRPLWRWHLGHICKRGRSWCQRATQESGSLFYNSSLLQGLVGDPTETTLVPPRTVHPKTWANPTRVRLLKFHHLLTSAHWDHAQWTETFRGSKFSHTGAEPNHTHLKRSMWKTLQCTTHRSSRDYGSSLWVSLCEVTHILLCLSKCQIHRKLGK